MCNALVLGSKRTDVGTLGSTPVIRANRYASERQPGC
jgi:hypothetical protein